MVKFRMHLIIHLLPNGTLQDLYKVVQTGALEIELKGELQVLLELNLFMHLSMHNSVQYDSVKGEI